MRKNLKIQLLLKTYVASSQALTVRKFTMSFSLAQSQGILKT